MQGIPIQQASAATGWSPRMLRYVESLGLVTAQRSTGGYRLYGPEQLQRLRTLRQLVESHGVSLSDVGFAARLRTEAALRGAIETWLAESPRRPPAVQPADWLRWEQDKLQRLLAAGPMTPSSPASGAAPAPGAPTAPAGAAPGESAVAESAATATAPTESAPYPPVPVGATSGAASDHAASHHAASHHAASHHAASHHAASHHAASHHEESV